MELKPEMYATAEVSAPLQGYKDRITVPQTAVLWTGKRSIVYVKQPDTSTPTFLMREVELGPSLGNAYVILKVVTNGVFSIDASAQLEGKQSMMNNDGEAQPMSGHVGHTMSGHEGYAAHGTSAAQPEPAGEHAMFGVKGSCDMCKQRIETAAKSVNGVSSVHWDKEKQMIHLQPTAGLLQIPAISGYYNPDKRPARHRHYYHFLYWWRYSVALSPAAFLKKRLNAAWSSNPSIKAISLELLAV